jgi:hypothetical protein
MYEDTPQLTYKTNPRLIKLLSALSKPTQDMNPITAPCMHITSPHLTSPDPRRWGVVQVEGRTTHQILILFSLNGEALALRPTKESEVCP